MNRDHIEEPDGFEEIEVEMLVVLDEFCQQHGEHPHIGTGGKDLGQDEFFPAFQKCENPECDQRWLHLRQDQASPDHEAAGAILDASHLDFPWHRVVKALHDPDAQR